MPGHAPAVNGALDRLFGGRGLRPFVARRKAAQHVHELVDERDEQDDEAARIAELRDPQRDRQYALRHVVEAPRIVGHPGGVPGEEADEARADEQRDDLDRVAHAAPETVDQEPDADHLARAERVGEAEECSRRHAPGHDLVARRHVDADRAAGRQQHHEDEDGDEEQPGEPAGEQVEPVEEGAKHRGYGRVGITPRPGRRR